MAGIGGMAKFYFLMGFSQKEIMCCLSSINNVHVSLRTLQRVLQKARLFRRKEFSDILDVTLFLIGNLEGSSQLHGYKMVHQMCLQAGFRVTQETIRLLLQILDPEGVNRRRTGTIKRRIYINKGPNFLWHLDSYDKLKPFGICVNGAIDGFSRYVVWLRVFSTSSNPRVIAGYFSETILGIGGCPMRIRADFGTENGHVQQIQEAFRYDHADMFANRPFIRGTSVLNQRIECWWAFLRRHCAQFWIELFHGLKNRDIFNGDYLDKSLIQFVFINLIQKEFDELVSLWNTHRLRSIKGRNGPFGKPVIMYTLPHLYGSTNYMCEVPDGAIHLSDQYTSRAGPYPCDKDVFDLFCLLMDEQHLVEPADAEQGITLYENLRREIRTSL